MQAVWVPWAVSHRVSRLRGAGTSSESCGHGEIQLSPFLPSSLQSRVESQYESTIQKATKCMAVPAHSWREAVPADPEKEQRQ